VLLNDEELKLIPSFPVDFEALLTANNEVAWEASFPVIEMKNISSP
jgi:hypothetical protein